MDTVKRDFDDSELMDNKSPQKNMYDVKDVAQILEIPLRTAYRFCNTTTSFPVLKIGRTIKIPKKSFETWISNPN